MLNFSIDTPDTYGSLIKSIDLLFKGEYRRLRITNVTSDQRVIAASVLKCIENKYGRDCQYERLPAQALTSFLGHEDKNKRWLVGPPKKIRFLVIYNVDLMTDVQRDDLEKFALDQYVRIVYITGDF